MAVPAGIAAASTATTNATEKTLSMGGSRTPPLDPEPEPGQDVAPKQEEEQRPLKHRSNRTRQPDRCLELVAADQDRREQEADEDDAERMQPRQPGDDNRGIAISGR